MLSTGISRPAKGCASLLADEELRRLHVFELGPHGTHMGENLPPALHELTVVPELLINWLQLHGWMAPQPE
jgi:hypothetical protein